MNFSTTKINLIALLFNYLQPLGLRDRDLVILPQHQSSYKGKFLMDMKQAKTGRQSAFLPSLTCYTCMNYM